MNDEEYFDCVTNCPFMKLQSDGKCNFFNFILGIENNIIPSNYNFTENINKTNEVLDEIIEGKLIFL